MQKIIAGTIKGRRLRSLPSGPQVRPILARIKKSLFDILRPRIPGSRFLDLYAGSGSVGIEALSRGADSATFIERESACHRMIKDNLEMFGMMDRAEVIRQDVLGDLSYIPRPYDVIFMGPPYVTLSKEPLKLVSPTLVNIEKYQLCAPKGLIVAQHHKKEEVELPSEKWSLFRAEEYGDSILSFIHQVTP